jgi:hypothetical protein
VPLCEGGTGAYRQTICEKLHAACLVALSPIHSLPPDAASGAKPILRWELRLVMAVGVDTPHPANKKAKLRVYLRDLQQEADLSDAALQYIARICGPRCAPG